MRVAWVGVVRALLATLLGVTGACLGAVTSPGTLGAPLPAHAAEPPAYASVRFDRLTPALPAPTDTITLTGEVTNTAKVSLSNLQAVFWRSFDPISDREGLDAALGSAANEPLGERVKPNAKYQNIPSETDRTLAPGERARFSLRVTVADLEVARRDAIYLVGVHIRGRTSPTGPDITVGRGRIFLPLVTSPPPTAVRVTSIVVLASRPALINENLFADDHLAAELRAGGRLQALLAAADRDDASFAVDPALVQELQTMKAGYRVLGTNGSESTAGTGSADAGRWLTAFETLSGRRDGYRLLFGSVDATALVHAGQTELLAHADTLGRTVPATARLPLLVLPGRGLADSQTVTAVAALRPAAIVLSSGSADGPGPLLEGPDGSRIVRYTVAAADGGPGPDPQDTAAQVQQRGLAESWLTARAAPIGSTVGSVRLVTSAAQAASTGAAFAAPWVSPGTLRQLMAGPPSAWDQRFRYPDSARRRELTVEQLIGLRSVSASYATLAELTAANRTQTDARAATARAASTGFRSARRSHARFIAAQQNVLALIADQVTIQVSKRFLTTGRNTQLPVTVENNLPPGADRRANTVRVRLNFDVANPQRLVVGGLTVPPLPAGESHSGKAAVTARTNGIVRVTAYLTTISGTRIGQPVDIEVNATQAGTTGWIIALAAGLVLVGTTALRIRQVARERSAGGGDDSSAGSGRGGSARGGSAPGGSARGGSTAVSGSFPGQHSGPPQPPPPASEREALDA